MSTVGINKSHNGIDKSHNRIDGETLVESNDGDHHGFGNVGWSVGQSKLIFLFPLCVYALDIVALIYIYASMLSFSPFSVFET